LGRTTKTPAIRAIAELEQRVKHIRRESATLSATRPIFKNSTMTSTEQADQLFIIRLPLTQTSNEKGTGFNTLKQAFDLISEDFKRYLFT
jgi:hypothetical protein